MMYNRLLSFVLFIGFLFLGEYSTAQSCSKYYSFDKGTEFEITNFDKKKKISGKVHYIIADVVRDGFSEITTFETEIFDNNNKSISKLTYNLSCKDNVVSIDFSSLINPEIFSQYEGMEVELSGKNIEIPNNLFIGQNLPDANVVMQVQMNPIIMKIKVDLKNRKVEAREQITTQAGTFDCFVISYDTEFKMGIMRRGKSKQWISEGIGMVKQAEYNKKGKLMAYSELTFFKK